MREGFVVVAHGSSDPHAASALGELVPLVAHRAKERGLSVPDLRIAYLGHAAPSVPQVMRAFGPDMRVRVLPLLLTAAYHSKTDLPRVLARTGVPVRYGNPLGPHPLLLRALERRLPKTALQDPADTGVVLAAAGSSDPAANATIARLAEPVRPGPVRPPGGPRAVSARRWRPPRAGPRCRARRERGPVAPAHA